MDNVTLIALAKKAREFSFADITTFRVGAALLSKSGEVFLGCNIEDPSGIGVTNICAERCAIIKAVSEGVKDFEKIAIVGGLHEPAHCMPCGVCRQYLLSFNPNIKVVCMGENNAIHEYHVHELLPFSFTERFEH